MTALALHDIEGKDVEADPVEAYAWINLAPVP